jgi:hypothetical protein
MAKKKDVKKQEKAKTQKSEVSMNDLLPKLEELNINVVKRAKRTALKKDGRVLTYVHDSPGGIHYFQRQKGARLNSGYAGTKKELDDLVTTINMYIEEHEKEEK